MGFQAGDKFIGNDLVYKLEILNVACSKESLATYMNIQVFWRDGIADIFNKVDIATVKNFIYRNKLKPVSFAEWD